VDNINNRKMKKKQNILVYFHEVSSGFEKKSFKKWTSIVFSVRNSGKSSHGGVFFICWI
jgi:hypothetical protein